LIASTANDVANGELILFLRGMSAIVVMHTHALVLLVVLKLPSPSRVCEEGKKKEQVKKKRKKKKSDRDRFEKLCQ
jgi:hypothetical protein